MLADEWTQIVATLGTTVRDLRLLLGWSQDFLAKQAVVSQGSISRMESGHCGNLPFRSVVVILQTLAAGAARLHVRLSPAAAHLLAFAPLTNGAFTAIEPPDSDLAYIAQTMHRIPRPHRPRFLAIVRAAAAALDAAEPPLPDLPPINDPEE